MPIFLQVKNEAVSILAAAIDAVVTSLSVTAGEGAKFPLPGAGFNITIDAEILKCTARATDTLTVTRAQEGTTAAAHSLGATVSLNITAKLLDDITANLLALDTSQVTTGRFIAARLLDGTAGYFLKAGGAGIDPAYVLLAAADIPSLDTAKITTGRFIAARLLDGTAGYFLKAAGAGLDPAYALLAAADIPALDQAKITTGRFPMARILDGTAGLVLTAQGAAVDPAYAAVAAGHPDLLLTYMLAGTAVFIYAEEGYFWATCFPDTYTDLAVQTYVSLSGVGATSPLWGRATNRDNFYASLLQGEVAAADHTIRKFVAGAATTLATEAIDITPYYIRSMKLSCLGTTIKSYRADLVTAKLSVTDTSLASGYFGIGQDFSDSARILSAEGFLLARKVAAGSPTPRPIGYFEVPIIGSGKMEDPYRVRMPEFIETHPQFEKTNRFALTHSDLIPTDDRGQPLHSTALVRIFAQLNRQVHLTSEATCITELKAQAGVREIPKVTVKARAKGMDRKLKDEDLTPDTGWE